MSVSFVCVLEVSQNGANSDHIHLAGCEVVDMFGIKKRAAKPWKGRTLTCIIRNILGQPAHAKAKSAVVNTSAMMSRIESLTA